MLCGERIQGNNEARRRIANMIKLDGFKSIIFGGIAPNRKSFHMQIQLQPLNFSACTTLVRLCFNDAREINICTRNRAEGITILHIYCSDVRSYSSAPESNKQNPCDRTPDLPILFRYKRIPSLKNLPSPAPNESLPYWFQGNFAASFVLNFCLREFLLSAFANRFELRCEPKNDAIVLQICPSFFFVFATKCVTKTSLRFPSCS